MYLPYGKALPLPVASGKKAMWYGNAYEENGVASPLLTWEKLCNH